MALGCSNDVNGCQRRLGTERRLQTTEARLFSKFSCTTTLLHTLQQQNTGMHRTAQTPPISHRRLKLICSDCVFAGPKLISNIVSFFCVVLKAVCLFNGFLWTCMIHTLLRLRSLLNALIVSPFGEKHQQSETVKSHSPLLSEGRTGNLNSGWVIVLGLKPTF